ncbi:MAG: phosphatidylserine decarboxylase [Elusimicrobia bacterium]|nr:phosphatidylserine decarboxylase [Elusimicrobiota bacterium]
MRLAGPGKKMVLGSLGAALAAFMGGSVWNCCLLTSLGGLCLAFSAFSAYFFRDPERPVLSGPEEILCPADGTVMSIRQEGPAEVITVRIFLAIWNVHVQRAPLSGTVKKIHYQPGGFAMAMKPEAARNERNSIRIQAEGGRFAIVEQIAGAIARRIACWVKEGEQVAVGVRIGMIYFGSQCAVHLPASVKVLVHPGQKVQGNLTVLAKWLA